ncbi:MAG: TonB-dependent receptor [Pseudomonadota bacterium]
MSNAAKQGASVRESRHVLFFFSVIALLAAGWLSPASAQDGDDAESTRTLEEIVVRGVRQQIQEATQIEREAVNIQSVITADDIGQFPDQNIAESLQRLPGLVIVRDEGEGRFVSVRGLPSDFVQVTVNNAQIGSSDDGGNRSTALDVIPSDLLSKVAVNKSLLADQDHDSLGAKIDLRPLSAFDRGDTFTARILAQATYTEMADEARPKITADFTRRFNTERGEFGIAAAANYFEREIQLDRLQTDSGGGIRLVERDDFDEGTGDEEAIIEPGFDQALLPQELDQRLELGRRDRIGATLTLDYRLDGGSEYSFSALYGRLEDDDVRLQQEVELRDANADEIVAIGARSGQFSDVDIDRQTFFQPREEDTLALHFEGKNPVGSDWTLSYAADYSRNRFTIDNGLRGQFRERDLIVDANWGQTAAGFDVVGRGDNDDKTSFELGFQPDLDDFPLNQLLIIDEDREDDIWSGNIDLERAFTLNGRDATIKFGVKHRDRERSFLRGEREIDDDAIEDAGFELTLADVPNFRPDSGLPIDGGLADGAIFPAIEPFRTLLSEIRAATGLVAGDSRRDFTAEEQTLAGYVSMQVELSDTLSLVGGVRIEETEFSTTGTFGRTFTEDEDNAGFDFETIQTFDSDYREVLPNLSLRWEPTEQTLVRFGYSRGQVRPSYGDASALRTLSVDYLLPADADPGAELTTINLNGTPTQVAIVESEIEGGNPNLEALIADQIDATFGWYPADNTVLTAAVFYKDLTNTFIGVDFDEADSITGVLGFNVDPVSGAPIGELETTINGGDGEVLGLELSASHFFDYLQGPLSGLFVSGNITLIDAESSDPSVRDGAAFRLPGSSEESGNLSLGYETDNLLVRFAMNYRGEALRSIGDDPEEDEFQESFFTLDATVRYNFTDNFQVFFDAININEETESRYFRGVNNQPLYSRFEDFGRTFQLGVVSSF